MAPTFNLADVFELVAHAIPDRVALVQGPLQPRRRTYAELDERATRLADALATGHGLAAGEYVGLDVHNGCEFLETMLACYKLRAVPVNVNYRYVAAELAPVLADAGAVGVLCDSLTARAVRAATAAMPDVWVVETGAGYDALVDAGRPDRTFEPRSGDDHYVLYTGGTTGMPRGVVWRHEDIFFTALGGGNPGGAPVEHPEQAAMHAVVNRAQRVAPFLPDGDPGPAEFVALSIGPLVHASGQWIALGTLLAGGRVVLYDEPHFDVESVLDLVEQEHVVMLTFPGDTAAVPLVECLTANPDRWDVSSVRLLGSGASILSGETRARLFAAFPAALAISEAVGSSEAPVAAVAVARRDGPPVASLAFTARAGITLVVDDDLRPVEPGSDVDGWLAAGGRVPLGYHNDPERTAKTFVTIEGARYAIPGDRARLEADGTIRLLGRGALCINTGGEKVFPEEVEAALKEHPSIADAVVVGAPDERWGQRVAAVVSVRAGAAAPSLASVQEHCRSRLAGYKVPRSLTVVDRVERSPAGKADYRWAAGVASRVTSP
jgi:acyl-CoA synthetase (AMP-forming)/AMP-acid ligase II